MASKGFADRPSEWNKKYIKKANGEIVRNIAARETDSGKSSGETIAKSREDLARNIREPLELLKRGNWEPRLDTGIPASDNPKHLHEGLKMLYAEETGGLMNRDPNDTINEAIGRMTSKSHLKNPGAAGSEVVTTLRCLDLIDDDKKLTEHGHVVMSCSPAQRTAVMAKMFSDIPETGMSHAEREKMWEDGLAPDTVKGRHRVIDNMAKFAKDNGYPPETRTAETMKRTSSPKSTDTGPEGPGANETLCSSCFLYKPSHTVNSGVCNECR